MHKPREGKRTFTVVKISYSKDFPKAGTGPNGISEITFMMSEKCVQNTEWRDLTQKNFSRAGTGPDGMSKEESDKSVLAIQVMGTVKWFNI